MPYVKTSRLKIEYKKAGEGPHAIVLVHGNFASWRWWQPFLERLPRGFTAYAPVTRGCGDFRGNHSNFSMKRLARDLHLFVKAMGIKKFHLVGHSLGGAIATQFALDFPKGVKTLTLVAPAPPDGLKSMGRENRARSPRSAMVTDNQNSSAWSSFHHMFNVGRFWGMNRFYLDGALRKMMPSLSTDFQGFGQLVTDATKLGSNTIAGFYQALDQWDVRGRLAQLRMPTRILWGELDAIIPKKAMKAFNKALPKSKMVVWRGTGHTPQLEKPEKFVNFLVGFISTTSVPLFVYWLLYLMENRKWTVWDKIKHTVHPRRLTGNR